MGLERLFENFENVSVPEECKLIGNVPFWLQGTMLRNGPGMFKIGDTEYRHWFDGMAYVQRYHFKDGKMFYSAKYLEGDDYKKNMRAQRIIATSFGTMMYPDPCKTIFQRLTSFFSKETYGLDNCSIAFLTAGDGVYALTESPSLLRIDADTLDTLEKVDMRNFTPLTVHSNTAHWHTDSEGNLYNIGTIMGRCYVFTKTTNPLHAEVSLAADRCLLDTCSVCTPSAARYCVSRGGICLQQGSLHGRQTILD